MEGVLCDRASQCDVFFITLKKSERLFSATGQRYINHPVRGSRVMLPFLCLGFADYVSHEAERIWFVPKWRFRRRLEREFPAAWLPELALAV